MAQKDMRISKHGIDVRKLEVGMWVELEWNDAPNEIALIVSLEERHDSYKGERSVGTMSHDAAGWFIRMASATHTQIVRVVGKLQPPSLEPVAVKRAPMRRNLSVTI